MKRFLSSALVLFLAAGCSTGTITKSFRVTADPSDAAITVASGVDMKQVKYRSPAAITVQEPTDPALAARAVLSVSKDAYLTRTIALRDIENGQSLNIKLERIIKARYKATFQLLSPVQSDALQFRDRNIAVSLALTDQAIQLRLENLTSAAVKILWDRAQYMDEREQPHRLMHSGIRFQDRNNPIPDQSVQPRAALQQGIYPIRNVVVTGGRPPYTVKRLLPLDSEAAEGLKGKTLALFLPVEINRAVIPYNFKIQIIDVVKEEAPQ